MKKNEYRKRKVHSGELRTPVIFYEYQPVEGPYPDQEERKEMYSCWAKVESVWLRDLEQAKQNGTESDVTLTIRDPLQEFIPTTNISYALTHTITNTWYITSRQVNPIYNIVILLK